MIPSSLHRHQSCTPLVRSSSFLPAALITSGPTPQAEGTLLPGNHHQQLPLCKVSFLQQTLYSVSLRVFSTFDFTKGASKGLIGLAMEKCHISISKLNFLQCKETLCKMQNFLSIWFILSAALCFQDQSCRNNCLPSGLRLRSFLNLT